MARAHGTDGSYDCSAISALNHMDRQITLLAQAHLSEINRGHCAVRGRGARSTVISESVGDRASKHPSEAFVV